MRVGSITASARVFPSESLVIQGLPETSTTLRIKEKPLEWGPLEASPRTTSPRFDAAAVNNLALFDQYRRQSRQGPYSPAGYMPGISAVSPPINAQPAQFAAVCDAFDNAFGNVDIKMTAGEVVKEE